MPALSIFPFLLMMIILETLTGLLSIAATTGRLPSDLGSPLFECFFQDKTQFSVKIYWSPADTLV